MRTALAEIYVDLTQMHGALKDSPGDHDKAREAIETAAHCVAVAANCLDGEVTELQARDLAIMGIHSVLLFIEDRNEGFDERTRSLARRLRNALFTDTSSDIQGTVDCSPRDADAKRRH